jgi:hypothetical protein
MLYSLTTIWFFNLRRLVNDSLPFLLLFLLPPSPYLFSLGENLFFEGKRVWNAEVLGFFRFPLR